MLWPISKSDLHYLPMVGSIFSELDKNEFSKPTAVVVGNGPGIAKRLPSWEE